VQPFALAFLVGFADAFVPSIPRRSSVVLFRKRSYLDDLGDPEPADDNSSPVDESPKSEYLEDMSVKEAESPNEPPSDVSVDEDEAEPIKSPVSPTESVEKTLEDMSVKEAESANESPSDVSVDEDEAEPIKSPVSPTESVEETLEDMSVNEAESPNEPPSDVSVDEDEAEPIKSPVSPTESVEKTLEDMSMNEAESPDETPSGVSVDEDEAEPIKSPVSPTESAEKTLTTLLQISASTGRGEFATAAQKEQASSLIFALELQNPTPEPTNSPLINGRWELLYSSTQLFRSSPFFMAGRAVCSTPEQAKQYDWFCEMHRKALAISSIGQVRQVVSPTSLVSEFEVKVGAVPFLSDSTPFAYSGGWPVSKDLGYSNEGIDEENSNPMSCSRRSLLKVPSLVQPIFLPLTTAMRGSSTWTLVR
jgi:hypothetical protein